ncbi:MAG: photosystem II assembly protein Psb35 [Cyanobacterium sp.]
MSNLIFFAVAGDFPIYFVAVYVVGLVAAVSIGLIAWYNSKRPVGWEDSQKPDFIPDLKTNSQSSPEDQE